MKERIQKVLANFGVDSRRNIELMIGQGRIAVNGKVVTKLPVLIDPEKDKVTVDDESVRLATTRKGAKPVEKMYFLLNKPRRVYSTNVAQGEQRLAKDLLPPDLPSRVYPVGRLDADSKGLLLLTNDGELTNLLTHPRYEVSKTYRAEVDGTVTDATIKTLQEGIWLADKEGKGFKTGKCKIKVIFRGKGATVMEVTIREGRNRQVRRMLAKFGHKVRDLTRIQMGPLTLSGVGPGKFRPLTEWEVKQLYSTAKSGGAKAAARPDGPAAAAAKKATAAKAAGGKKAPAAKRPAVRQADVGKDLAVEFEDDELRREMFGEAAPAARAAADAGDDEGSGAGVEFVDLSP
ncbi:MAG: pseudouridine synthase Rsu, partial [Phycisphaerales bacterium]|nr:pseudouridine synthase Rsu [Phycisphaerales bacterium]